MKLILPLLFLLFFSSKTFSQTDKSSAQPVDLKNDPEYLRLLEASQNFQKARTSSVSLSLVSEYFGLDSKIAGFFIDNQIPATFPKSAGYTNRNQYITDLNVWLDKNQNLLKLDKKNNLITE